MNLFYSVGVSSIFETLQDKETYDSIFLTLKASFYAVLFVCFTGIPLAYLIARYNFWGKSVLESLLDIPVMVPHTAAGIALLISFSNGYIGEFLSYLGLEFIDTTTGIISAMMFLSAPFLINGAKEGFKKVDVKYEYVARTLGASKISVFLSISLPNAKNDILNGALMMWSRGLGEFGAVVIIAYHPMITPVLIYDKFNNFGLKLFIKFTNFIVLFTYKFIRKFNTFKNDTFCSSHIRFKPPFIINTACIPFHIDII